MFARLERASDKQKRHHEQTLKSLSEHTRQKGIDDGNLRDFKNTIFDLSKQIERLRADQHAFPMLNQHLSTLTTPDVVYMVNVTPLSSCIKYWLPNVRHLAPT